MALKAGDIIHVFCTFISDHKFVVCICPDHPLFFLINSEPRRSTLDAQVLIKQAEFKSFLKQDSYINTATPITIYPLELSKAKSVGILTDSLKSEIVKVVKECGHLSPIMQTLIENNLSITP
jgi:hypothetical protein